MNRFVKALIVCGFVIGAYPLTASASIGSVPIITCVPGVPCAPPPPDPYSCQASADWSPGPGSGTPNGDGYTHYHMVANVVGACSFTGTVMVTACIQTANTYQGGVDGTFSGDQACVSQTASNATQEQFTAHWDFDVACQSAVRLHVTVLGQGAVTRSGEYYTAPYAVGYQSC